MPTNMNLFVSSTETINVFAQALEETLGVKLQPLSDQPPVFYRFSDGEHKWFDVGTHFLDNEPGLDFENFRYQIEIGIFNVRDWQERREMCYEFANSIFEKLKASEKYRLMLMLNVTKKIAEYVPGSQEAE